MRISSVLSTLRIGEDTDHKLDCMLIAGADEPQSEEISGSHDCRYNACSSLHSLTWSLHSLRFDELEEVEWETDEPANEDSMKKSDEARRMEKWNELHALLAERGELHLWPLTLKRKASSACGLVMNIGIQRLDYIIDLIRTSKEKIDETDERVQNASEHTAVWVNSQEATATGRIHHIVSPHRQLGMAEGH